MSYPTPFVAGDQLPAADLNDAALSPAVTYGETITVLYALRANSDGKVYLLRGNTLANATGFIGFAAESGVLNDTKRILGPGKLVTGLSGLTANAPVYISDTSGVVSSTPGTYSVMVGWAITSTSLVIVKPDSLNPYGSGVDGVLSASSGTTTLNTSGKNIYQYQSVSLTGTAALAIGSNLQNVPVFIFVQGDLTITASGTSVTAKGRGGPLGGAGTGGGTGGAGTAGTSGATALSANFGGGGSVVAADNHAGNGGGGGGGYGNAGTTGTPSAGGTGGAGGASWSLYNAAFPILREIGNAFIGGGGGGGGGAKETGNTNNAGDGGAGGNGGGCLIFIVGGSINLTTGTITVAGDNGSNGVNKTDYGGGGGGGGGGGFCGIYYAGSVTANTITITAAAGSGGSGGTGGTAGGAGGAGGAGQYEVRQIKTPFFAI